MGFHGNYNCESYPGLNVPQTEDCVFVMVTGIGELRELQLNLYPNPAIDQLNISSTQTINRITIYNNASQVVYQQEMGGKKSVTLNTLSY